MDDFYSCCLVSDKEYENEKWQAFFFFLTSAGSSVRLYKFLELRLYNLQWNTVSILLWGFISYLFILVF